MGEKVVSKFSLFKHRIAGLFKDIVEAPEEPKEVVEEVPEIKSEIVDEEVEEQEFDEDKAVEEERERTRERIHEHIVGNLNEAVARWKETGDVGLHLEPPVPLREKVRLFWERMRPSGAVSAKLKDYVDEVIEKVSSRVKKAEDVGEHVDADVVVEEEWGKVLRKIESVSSSSEREEIEKIYKELSGK